MEKTKIQLSADELQLMLNCEWILTKNSVMEKLTAGLGELAMQMQEKAEGFEHTIGDIGKTSPKISRGEKYQGLPYLMLDYPRIFEKEHILAIRTFFWWGNFFSITLHVKGRFTETVLEKLITHMETLQEKKFYISVSGIL